MRHSLLLLYIGGVILPSTLELAGGWALYKLYHTPLVGSTAITPFNTALHLPLSSRCCGAWAPHRDEDGPPVIAGLFNPAAGGPHPDDPLSTPLYAADTIVTAFAASDLARDLDALEKVADSMPSATP